MLIIREISHHTYILCIHTSTYHCLFNITADTQPHSRCRLLLKTGLQHPYILNRCVNTRTWIGKETCWGKVLTALFNGCSYITG
jgi:hypothetical protein